MTAEDRFNAALDAWQEWCEPKRKSDATMSFVDCHRTAQAWVRFQNLYLGDQPPAGDTASAFGCRHAFLR